MEVKEWMTSETQVIFEAMERFSNLMQTEWLVLLKNLSGNLEDIPCGTLIKIPMDVGYASYFKSQDAARLSLWMQDSLMLPKKDQNQEKLI